METAGEVRTAVLEQDQVAEVVCLEQADRKGLDRLVGVTVPLVRVPVPPAQARAVQGRRGAAAERAPGGDGQLVDAAWQGFVVVMFPLVAVWGLVCSVWMHLQPSRGKW
ncbi:unnamed protein product [Prorocentrum cordatum]|uniref:Uncharacterized protein n=1 Tax=Prorocentrum cordatum TaxID=2364126 RepID=A0ABN9W5N9_9DINO|nr:unnamed protein product [Polarella glacialis]